MSEHVEEHPTDRKTLENAYAGVDKLTLSNQELAKAAIYILCARDVGCAHFPLQTQIEWVMGDIYRFVANNLGYFTHPGSINEHNLAHIATVLEDKGWKQKEVVEFIKRCGYIAEKRQRGRPADKATQTWWYLGELPLFVDHDEEKGGEPTWCSCVISLPPKPISNVSLDCRKIRDVTITFTTENSKQNLMDVRFTGHQNISETESLVITSNRPLTVGEWALLDVEVTYKEKFVADPTK